jgi:Tfp pilus assembly protein PilP
MRALQSLSLVVLFTSATTMVYAQQTKASTTPAAKSVASAPAPAPAAEAGKTVPSVTETAKLETSSDAYAYDPAGRRDPFLTLIGPSNDLKSKKGEGASGMAVGELTVRGVLESRGRLVAMVKGPDNKTYIVHQGDRLLDGAIKSITPQGLVIEQEVNDPLSVVKQREVRKLLRGLEETK